MLGFNWCTCFAQGKTGPPGPEGMRGPRGEPVRRLLMNQLNRKTKQHPCDYSVESLCFCIFRVSLENLDKQASLDLREIM